MALKLDDANVLAEKIEAVISNPELITALPDDAIRRRLRDAGRKLSLALEARTDAIHRIAYSPMQLALARVGVDIRLFELLMASHGSTSSELALKTQVDIVLMKRLLRFYQSVGMISQRDADYFIPNNITDALAWEGGRAGICVQSDLVAQSFLAFPQFLRETGYANPTDPKCTPFHLGTRTEQDLFQWIQAHPQILENFNIWMSSERDPGLTFLDVLDFEKELAQGTDEKTVLFVDIGGSKGHQSIALRRRYPNLPGRVILQDLPHVIEHVKADPLPGFETIETDSHDMFTPQTIKGARAYYFRHVFHDWPDDKCKAILENLKPGLTKDSVVLIDEIVVSDVNTQWRATLGDMTMAVCLAAMERTETEWRTLADEVGYKVLKVLKYRQELEDCVLVLALK
ncbi:S-adenosyl-L-methionine-dependent methyltransferase [Biscogniauxia marginata]|nr:S-adenosyl-L-methionine-dependent methyltransferase [Biscogniauxia marginata]